jgi:hypothetical protein
MSRILLRTQNQKRNNKIKLRNKKSKLPHRSMKIQMHKSHRRMHIKDPNKLKMKEGILLSWQT